MSSLEKAIIATICYFDVSDYPLTLVEIWKWLLDGYEPRAMSFELIKKSAEPQAHNPKLTDVQKALDDSQYLKTKIETKNGFYFLKGRKDSVEQRKKRYNIAEQKFKKAIKVIRLLRYLPFVKMIAICNTLAYSNSQPEADIDLFIITTKQHIWQARFWVTGFLKIFGLRPSPQKTQDTFCASFFIDQDNLNLKKLAIENDVYLYYWITQVYPVYDEGVYQQFIGANRWIKDKLVNSQAIRPSYRRRLDQVGGLKNIFEAFGRLFPESIFKNYQLKIMPAKLREMANKDSRVVIQDYLLKFHDIDRREEFRNLFDQRLTEIINE